MAELRLREGGEGGQRQGHEEKTHTGWAQRRFARVLAIASLKCFCCTTFGRLAGANIDEENHCASQAAYDLGVSLATEPPPLGDQVEATRMFELASRHAWEFQAAAIFAHANQILTGKVRACARMCLRSAIHSVAPVGGGLV